MLDGRVQRDQPPQQRRSQQAATRLRVGLPIDEHLAAPEAGAGQLVLTAKVSRQLGVRVGHGYFDARQARLNVHQVGSGLTAD